MSHKKYSMIHLGCLKDFHNDLKMTKKDQMLSFWQKQITEKKKHLAYFILDLWDRWRGFFQ